MATWVNREAWWAVDRNRVVHVVRVIAQDLDAQTMTVLLDNGARHEAPAYDIYLTEEAANLSVQFARDRSNGYGESQIETTRQINEALREEIAAAKEQP